MQRACEGAPECHHGPLRPLWLMLCLALHAQVLAPPLKVLSALLCLPVSDVLDLRETQMQP